MIENRACLFLVTCFLSLTSGTTIYCAPLSGSPASAAGGGPSNASGGASASSLSGVSYTQDDLQKLTTVPANPKKVVICFELKTTQSSAQPFILEQVNPNPAGECTTLDEKHPLLMQDLLVLRIDATKIWLNQFKLINLNVMSQQGTSINPSPIRPTFSSSLALASASRPAPSPAVPACIKGGKYYLTWPNLLLGDSIPTISVSAIYTPPVPGISWHACTFYLAGSVVTPSSNNGHFYTALTSGFSSDTTEPTFPVASPPTINDGSVVWLDFGTTLPPGVNATPWTPGKHYDVGTAVQFPYSNHFYTAFTAGTSGPQLPSLSSPPPGTAQDGDILWQDSGTMPPTAVTAGPPADQSISLWSFTFSQAHSLYHYNLSSGIVVGSIRNPSFVSVPSAAGASTYVAKRIDGNRSVDPVLFLSVYLHPFDAESPYSAKDLVPALTFGISLSSPSSSFYIGGSSEIRRNVQLVYGLNVAKKTMLVPEVAPSSTGPTTVQRFTEGAFIGITFNVGGFIQSLFGGGKGS